MSLKGKNEQIEHLERILIGNDVPEYKKRNVSYSRKKIKKMRNRLIRRWKKDEIPYIKYNGWEW